MHPLPLKHSHCLDTPIGRLAIIREAEYITEIKFLFTDNRTHTDTAPDYISAELNAYFKNAKHQINLPLQAVGTAYQHRVWKALCEIPSGTTLTYGELAKKLNSSPRAVGQACRKNPIPVIVPCHRVISANGVIGYAGETKGDLPAIKLWLLQHEQQSS